MAWNKVYIMYRVIRFGYPGGKLKMKNSIDKEEIRWQVVKSMLDEFPALRERVKDYIKKQKN